MASDFLPIRPSHLGEQVAERLRSMILHHQLEHGARLVEESLAKRFDVSRGPIRDAFRQLEREGLLESRRRGIFVVGMSSDDIADLYDLREALEVLAIKRAFVRATDRDLESGSAVLDELRDAAERNDSAAFAEVDMRFHAQIFRFSRNHRLTSVWKQYEPVFSTIMQSAVEADTELVASADDHDRLWQMIKDRDPAALEEASAHIERARDRMIATYERQIPRESTDRVEK